MASEVRELRERGVEPEEILVLFRHWSDEGDLALETLRSWGIAAHSNHSPSLLEPAVSALRLAISIPLEDWETEHIVRLLPPRHDRPRLARVERLALATAASTIKASLVFRGREKLLHGLDMHLARRAQDEVQ